MKLKRIAAGLAVSGAAAAAIVLGGNQASAHLPSETAPGWNNTTFYGCLFPYYGFVYFIQDSPLNEGACGPGVPISLYGAVPITPPPPPSGPSGSFGS